MKKHAILFLLSAFILAGCSSGEKKRSNFAEGTKSLPRTEAGKVGVNQDSIDRYLDFIETGGQEFHSFMVLREGKVIVERWWGDHAPDKPHIMNSVSKSFAATAVGFAIAEGLLTINDPVISFFPDQLPEEVSPYLRQLTVWHLLTMSVGQETQSKRDKDNDWIKDFLAHPIVHEPGTQFRYNSMASFMLSAIVQKLTGEKINDYLTPRLYEPLGIEGVRWEENAEGVNVGGWGMYLKTEDMAKFGQLFLQNGVWNGEQLLPQGWAEEASSYQVANSNDSPEEIKENPTDWNQGYGYQMWRTMHNGYRADGARGQEIIVLPDYDLVIIYTGHVSDLAKTFNKVWDTILPGVK